MSLPDPRPFASGAALLRRPEPLGSARTRRTPSSPRAEDEVQRSEYLDRAFRRASLRGRPLRICARASVGRAASQSPEPRGARQPGTPLPIVVGTLVPVEVERLPRGESRREPRVMWLWWHGPEGTAPDLDLIRRSYVRRFDLESTPSACSSRAWDGRRRGFATPNGPTSGVGWLWPPTHS
jgi:hypothetical protein